MTLGSSQSRGFLSCSPRTTNQTLDTLSGKHRKEFRNHTANCYWKRFHLRYPSLTCFLKNRHRQHAPPTALTAFIAARPIAPNGPWRPEATEVLLGGRAGFESNTISWNSAE